MSTEKEILKKLFKLFDDATPVYGQIIAGGLGGDKLFLATLFMEIEKIKQDYYVLQGCEAMKKGPQKSAEILNVEADIEAMLKAHSLGTVLFAGDNDPHVIVSRREVAAYIAALGYTKIMSGARKDNS